MKLEKITTARALDEMKAGQMVYMLVPADLSMTLEEYLLADFVLEEPEENEQFGGAEPQQKEGDQPILKDPPPPRRERR